MLFIYVDDILVVLNDTYTDIDYLAKNYVLKEGRMGPPDWYLGDNIKKVQTVDGGNI